MRSIRLSAWLLLAGMIMASPAEPSVSPTSAEQTLGLLSVELMNAVQSKDRKRLEGLLADDFALRMPGDAKSTGRAEWLANAVEMDWSNLRYENLVVRVHGDNATISSRLRFHVSPFPFGLDSGVVDTWERRSGRWQITARYLGESSTQLRVSFAAGVFSGALVAGLTFGVAWFARRSRKRAR